MFFPHSQKFSPTAFQVHVQRCTLETHKLVMSHRCFSDLSLAALLKSSHTELTFPRLQLHLEAAPWRGSPARHSPTWQASLYPRGSCRHSSCNPRYPSEFHRYKGHDPKSAQWICLNTRLGIFASSLQSQSSFAKSQKNFT